MSTNITRVAEAQLPTEFGRFRTIAYHQADTHQDHLVLLHEPIGAAPLVRLHSECLTGDALGSQRCDCGPQLRQSQRLIAAQGGLLVYLRQEGRGIGLANKIRAYALQDEGMDTLDANLHLGFGADERDYRVAAAILRNLGFVRVRLLTNNPAKVQGLQACGIEVESREALIIRPNPHNDGYLATKRDRMNHILPGSNRRHS